MERVIVKKIDDLDDIVFSLEKKQSLLTSKVIKLNEQLSKSKTIIELGKGSSIQIVNSSKQTKSIMEYFQSKSQAIKQDKSVD